tara:strand:- start:3343 stop:4035 length:693 start_codon:yes stop_codon:yes gene_type:complete
MSKKRDHKQIVTEQEKYIYNTYLRVYRTKQNKPFKYRKNFDNFDEYEYYVYIKKLGLFFKKFSHISVDNYFSAPYELYPEDNTAYDLTFYGSPRAIKVYSLYMKHLDQLDPDTDHHLQFAKDSLMYIFKFCRDNNLIIEDYTEQKTGDIPTFMLHLRDREVSIYSLFGFEDFEDKLNKVPNNRLEFTIGESFISSLAKYRTRYYTSRKNKQITKQGIKKIKTLLLTAKRG